MDPTSPQDCIDGLSSAEKSQYHKQHLVFISQHTPLLSGSAGVDTPTWLDCPVIYCVERHVAHLLVKPTAGARRQMIRLLSAAGIRRYLSSHRFGIAACNE
jgi:hypothetical protein